MESGLISKFKKSKGNVKYRNSTSAVGTKTNIEKNIPPTNIRTFSLEPINFFFINENNLIFSTYH